MDVSVIVVNYNTCQMTKQCIDSIFEKTRGIDYEVILVDNNSSDGSKEYFENIIADSISLFYGMVHKIKLASVSHFPSDLEVNCLIPNVNAKLVDKFLILDLSLLSDDCSFELVLSSKKCSYSSHFTIYAYKPIKLTDLFGEYCFGKNRLVLNSGLSHKDLEKIISDSLTWATD